MNISDLLKPESVGSLRYGDKMIGIVVKTPEDMKKDNLICCYIPRLMFGLPIDSGDYEKTVSVKTDRLLNTVHKNIGDRSLKMKNYVTVQVAQSNNVLPPKFAKGENVFVNCCDRDLKNLYAEPITLGEVKKRKNDIWTIMCPNFKEYDNSNMNLKNTFGMQINTKDKVISLWTSKEGGEESSEEKGVYYIGINAKEGQMLISDSGKRTITIDTDNDQIIMQNEAETKIEMIDDTINMKGKTLNIDIEDDINITSSKMKRDIDEINTSCDKDTEETDELNIKGNKLSSNYNDTKVESSSYENKTSKWKTDSPISGFTKVLTSDSYSQWSNAGVNPLPTCANISSSGIFTAGNPSIPSMGLAKAQPLISVLLSIAAKVDTIGSIVYCPPTAVSAVTAAMNLITSMNSMG
jgi:hypothetical protein